ncbi:DUF3037 domain-containing protein [Aquabacterium sp. A7-Y]|uniref:DUF3037 domain-containing protein n=1 Tax=Aquabacterium sp. A7-Y TaxID=1349605 RepID=UPI00223DC3B3|nr:DUF3037 domain-containing protein [Aquabacterium sp. A7-Y]MCW7540556.1 DUF3037 domain-containing protein [Aquabacterium sp. A7-Y]
MNKFACRYAVVQFMPYSETGEFVNVGVVLTCPATGYFDFRLQTRKYARVTGFFDELSPNVYRTALQTIQGELQRVCVLAAQAPVSRRADYVREVFTALVHPREAIVRFGGVRAVLTDSPEAELKRLFDDYVDRAFATPEYIEQTMTKRLMALLGSLNLPQPFRPAKIGDDEVHARFPLVQRWGDDFRKVIKPLNLTQDEPNGIFDHGDAWVNKVRRLRRKDLLPAEVLFAVAGPPETDIKRRAAFEEICHALASLDVQTVNEAADHRIVEFAST